MSRKSRVQRQADHQDAVKSEAGRLLLEMDRNPDKHMHLAEHRRRAVREGDTVSVEAIDMVWDDGAQHNAKAGPNSIKQARREMQRQQSEDARALREQADQKRVDQIMERGRSRAYGVGGREAANERGESGVDNRFPTRGRKRGRGAIGQMGSGANPGAPRG